MKTISLTKEGNIEVKQRNKNTNKKVLIMSCGTGGGHNSCARAIQEELHKNDIEADFIEYLDVVNRKMKNTVNNMYIKSTTGEGQIFKRIYKIGEIYEKTKIKSPVYLVNSLHKKKLYKYIKDNNYDLVVVTHLFPALALTALKKEKKEIHYIQVATDYVSIPFWEETNPDYFIIPSSDLEEEFINKGFKKSVLKPFGIPVSGEYSKTHIDQDTFKELELDENSKYILILNGSMGFGKIEKIVETLLKETEEVKYIISCGTNKKIFNKINDMYKDEERIIVLPFVNNLYKYMSIADIILTKPGGLTSTEVTTMRKPMIHTMPIPGCENYNADFFEKRGMSVKCDNTERIVEAIKELSKNNEEKNELILNQEKYIDNKSCEKVAEFIIAKLNRMWK